jgi:DNA processing protein
MEKNTLYWIWLVEGCGTFNMDINSILEQFDSIEEIYNETDYASVTNVKQSTLRKLKDKNLKKAENILKATQDLGADVVTYDDVRYPDALRSIPNPPYVLYMKGEIMNWDRILGIGIVGTRRSTEYGIKATKMIAGDLAACGVTIISGMARGIDTVAAEAALGVGNKTIAVLGCGIDVVYPSENKKLMDKIAENGTIITEYPPKTQPIGNNFPWRNRIISGLSRGVLVAEAPKKSGALITAEYALFQGKDIFAVPGSIFKPESEGANKLLASGAKAVTSAKDILDEYVFEIERLKIEKPTVIEKIFKGGKKINNEIKISLDDKRFLGLTDEDKQIISLLIEDNMHIDDIARRTGIDAGSLSIKLSMLEFSGHIQKIPGNNYKLNV